MQLILASQSPRRRELLGQAGYRFSVHPIKVSEIFDENLNRAEVARVLAERKAAVWRQSVNPADFGPNLLLTADTTVVLGDQILGKPESPAQAAEYLDLLSGKTHRVISAVCLVHLTDHRLWSGSDATEITFRKLTPREIEAYVAGEEPMDKAGAYAIQGGARDFVVKRVGSWSNVVGLPLELLESALAENRWVVDRRPTK